MEKSKRLTLVEASCIVAGYGIGGGVMAVPYLASLNGIASALLVMAAAYAVSLLLHLMIAEMFSGDDEPKQVVELFKKYLFRGRAAAILTWVFFVLMVIVFFTNLAAYISGAGEIIQSLTGLPLWAGEIIFYIAATSVVLFGLKALGISEKFAVLGIIIILLVLIITSFSSPFHTIPAFSGTASTVLAFFGMVMFCMASFFSVPQAAEGLSWNKKLIPKSVVLGITINLVFTLIITVLALLVSDKVTQVAIIGWAGALGEWVGILGSVFVLLAMVTTYWSISFALSTIVKERLQWSDRVSWLTATLPSFIIAVAGFLNFLGFMRLAGGGIAVLVAVLMIPAFRSSRKARLLQGAVAEWNMGAAGSTAFQLLVAAGYLLMAAGSVISIE